MKRTLFLAALLAIFATMSASTAFGQASTSQAINLVATGAVALGVKASKPSPPDGTTADPMSASSHTQGSYGQDVTEGVFVECRYRLRAHEHKPAPPGFFLCEHPG
ncbi:MAG: hypothetical protein MUO33_07880, partial [Sedimentisphaerales bacterium]|nr:hypothetical protein [Sedimentisphaerales bacterium]